jgi:flavin reductase (DIM6/NTAB) family NADH-FMN oxidoreductase RutF
MKSILNQADLDSFSRFYRANLINCLTGTKPAMLIGTTNVNGATNLALFNNIFHVGADPALIGYVQRPVDQSGDTYRNIINTKEFSINWANKEILEQAHQTSARYNDDISEFEVCGLTPEYLEGCKAPYVKECHINILLELVETIPVSINNTIIVIGKVKHILIPNALIKEDGNIDVNADNALSIVGLEQYYTTKFEQKMDYAKVVI